MPLVLRTISDLLCVPKEEWPLFFRWSEAVIPGATDWSDEGRARLSSEMVTNLLAAATDRRVSPRDDMISELGAAEVDGDRLTDAALGMFLVQLLVAGNEMTRNMMSGGLIAFSQAPGACEALAERASSRVTPALPLAVEEILRWTTPVVAFVRTTTQPVELGGRMLGVDEPVLMLDTWANGDEEAFGLTAANFDRERDPNPHVALGFGAHFCIGALLARVEGGILLEELLARLGSIAPAGEVVRTPSATIAGVNSAPVVFGAR